MSPPQASHDQTHEDLLHAHVAGDVPADDPNLIGRLEQCGECRARLSEWNGLTGLLDRLGAAQRASLQPDPGAHAPGLERVAATLQALAAGREPIPAAPLRPVRRVTLWRVGLAAASVLAAGWIVKVLLPPAEEAREDVLLGEGRVRATSPHGRVASLAPIDWQHPPPDAQRFALRVWRLEGAAEHLVLEESVGAFPWFPTPAQLAAMGESIRWEIVPYDSAGFDLKRETGEATTRP